MRKLFNDLSSEMTEDFADVMNNKDNVTGLAIDFGFELDNKFSLYTEYAQLQVKPQIQLIVMMKTYQI